MLKIIRNFCYSSLSLHHFWVKDKHRHWFFSSINRDEFSSDWSCSGHSIYSFNSADVYSILNSRFISRFNRFSWNKCFINQVERFCLSSIELCACWLWNRSFSFEYIHSSIYSSRNKRKFGSNKMIKSSTIVYPYSFVSILCLISSFGHSFFYFWKRKTNRKKLNVQQVNSFSVRLFDKNYRWNLFRSIIRLFKQMKIKMRMKEISSKKRKQKRRRRAMFHLILLKLVVEDHFNMDCFHHWFISFIHFPNFILLI